MTRAGPDRRVDTGDRVTVQTVQTVGAPRDGPADLLCVNQTLTLSRRRRSIDRKDSSRTRPVRQRRCHPSAVVRRR
ncbi:MAG: hypothetical protein AVDCRST_MAG66-3307 [uncultured Pseudonocardia sp.]|uniref:Uncharacterized protein n=1 Tax=uncultured Pseudonocardia sp. TaxID=211455 RepID=A0A6J4PZT7_9PSEU|nr:MAG: hypothetical protein AVDCRST_MAG66-3307 [uncultured Pseudonocardia sp.]